MSCVYLKIGFQPVVVQFPRYLGTKIEQLLNYLHHMKYKDQLIELSPFEVLFDKRVLGVLEQIPKTSEEQFIRIAPTYIRKKCQPQSLEKKNLFFESRSIDPKTFQTFKLDDRLEDKLFALSDASKNFIKEFKSFIFPNCEKGVYPLLGLILHFVFKQHNISPSLKIETPNKYGNYFDIAKRSSISPDYVLVDKLKRAVIIFEFKSPKNSLSQEDIPQKQSVVRRYFSKFGAFTFSSLKFKFQQIIWMYYEFIKVENNFIQTTNESNNRNRKQLFCLLGVNFPFCTSFYSRNRKNLQGSKQIQRYRRLVDPLRRNKIKREHHNRQAHYKQVICTIELNF